jgi:hypothetical protein
MIRSDLSCDHGTRLEPESSAEPLQLRVLKIPGTVLGGGFLKYTTPSSAEFAKRHATLSTVLKGRWAYFIRIQVLSKVWRDFNFTALRDILKSGPWLRRTGSVLIYTHFRILDEEGGPPAK